MQALLASFAVLLLLASANFRTGASTDVAYAANQQPGTKNTRLSVKDTANTNPSLRAKGGRAAPAKINEARAGSSRKSPAKKVRSAQAKAPSPTRLKIAVPCRAWVPRDVQPKVILLCVHGLGLNSNSFEDFGQQMKKEGIGTFAVDVRGFGTWMQLKGKGKCDFASCLKDVEKALITLHTAYPAKPIVVLGESMGGAIAMRVVAEHQELADGLISSVPSGDRFHKTKNELRVALHLVTLRGNQPIDIGSQVIKEATDDPATRAKWQDDPLNRLQLSSKELLQFHRFMNDNHETAKRITKTPVLFLVGLSDKLVKPKGTVELYNEIATGDKKLVTIRSAEHLIFEQHTLSPQLKSVVVGWLSTRTKKTQEQQMPPTQTKTRP